MRRVFVRKYSCVGFKFPSDANRILCDLKEWLAKFALSKIAAVSMLPTTDAPASCTYDTVGLSAK